MPVIDLGLSALAILALAAVARWARRSERAAVDAGTISDSWLAEHNARRRDQP